MARNGSGRRASTGSGKRIAPRKPQGKRLI